jgi:hypothetical protein
VKCKHIYYDVKADKCSDCGRVTHETDWQKQRELHKQWIADGKAKFGGWWSI